MFSVILYMLRQTVGHRAPLLLFPFSPLTVSFPKLSVILPPLYSCLSKHLINLKRNLDTSTVQTVQTLSRLEMVVLEKSIVA
jgi:hypothetical protein